MFAYHPASAPLGRVTCSTGNQTERPNLHLQLYFHLIPQIGTLTVSALTWNVVGATQIERHIAQIIPQDPRI